MRGPMEALIVISSKQALGTPFGAHCGNIAAAGGGCIQYLVRLVDLHCTEAALQGAQLHLQGGKLAVGHLRKCYWHTFGGSAGATRRHAPVLRSCASSSAGTLLSLTDTPCCACCM